MAMSYHTTKHDGRRKSLTVLDELQVIQYSGRTYKLLSVKTQEGLPYICLRLYNSKGHFIKQFLFEHAVAKMLGLSLTPVDPSEANLSIVGN